MLVQWKPRAAKQLKKLKDPVVIKRIYCKVAELELFPDTSGVKSLVNHVYAYRLRAGDYRVFFNVLDNGVEVISIEEVKKRDERTY